MDVKSTVDAGRQWMRRPTEDAQVNSGPQVDSGHEVDSGHDADSGQMSTVDRDVHSPQTPTEDRSYN